MILALVAGGAAVVTVAPAASAAVVTKTFAQGSMEIELGATRLCTTPGFGPQVPSSWFRRFSLAAELKPGEALSATSVSFGVEFIEPPSGASSVDVKVRVYRYPASVADLTWDALQEAPHTEATAVVRRDREVVRIDHGFGSFDRSEDVVVEIFYPGGSELADRFAIGSNNLSEDQTSYIRYPTCAAKYHEIHPADVYWTPMNAVIAFDGEIGPDRDGDRVQDEADVCPNRAGPSGSVSSGCPSFRQVVSPVFDHHNTVSGTVSIDVPGGTDSASCLGPVEVSIWNAESGAPLGSEMSTRQQSTTPRTFAIDASQIAEGTRVGVSAGEYLDKTTQGEPIAVCTAADTAYVTIGSKTDWDGDGVLNADDACPQVEGEPADDDYNGCPRVQRELSASFADEVVTGTMSASDGACLGTTNVVVSAIGANGSRSTVGQAQTAGDGTFTAPLTQSLADRTQLEVQVPRLYLDQKVLCLEDTYSVEVVRDADGDGRARSR